jgi:hypothetical protein
MKTIKVEKTFENKSIKGFKYQVEHFPNPECVELHSRVRLPQCDGGECLDLKTLIKNVGKPGWSMKRVPDFYRDLAKIRGLKEATNLHGYSLHMTRHKMFSWDEILPKVLKVIQKRIAKGRKMVDLGEINSRCEGRRIALDDLDEIFR